MPATEDPAMPSRWRAAIANLHGGLERLQVTADAIAWGTDQVPVDPTSPIVFDAVERHVCCLAEYEVALSCVLALMHEHRDAYGHLGPDL